MFVKKIAESMAIFNALEIKYDVEKANEILKIYVEITKQDIQKQTIAALNEYDGMHNEIEIATEHIKKAIEKANEIEKKGD